MTKEQKHQAEAAIYGIQENHGMNAQTPISNADIERMRQLVNQHDQLNRSFDLNNPPKENYRHQEFPRLVYHHEERAVRSVEDSDQLAQAEADGYRLEPYPAEEPEEALLDEESQQEVAKIQKQLKQLRKAKK